MRIRTLTAALGVAMLTVALGAACSSDSSEPSDGDLVAAIGFIDAAGLHGIDDAINEDKEIPAGAANTARKLQAALQVTEWPGDLQDKADELATVFEEMHATLSAENADVAAAGEIAARAHDLEHDFSAAVWAHLYDEAGIDVPEGDGH